VADVPHAVVGQIDPVEDGWVEPASGCGRLSKSTDEVYVTVTPVAFSGTRRKYCTGAPTVFDHLTEPASTPVASTALIDNMVNGVHESMTSKAITADLTGADWKKTGRSGPYTDNCVEVAFIDGAIAVRDSKNPTGPVLVFTPGEWDAFVDGAKDGEFDL
jgi:hypothetical protein